MTKTPNVGISPSLILRVGGNMPRRVIEGEACPAARVRKGETYIG